jgi:PAS domain S-box-containing protein
MEASPSAPSRERVGTSGPNLPWWTWVLPALLFHLCTGLSLQFQIARGMSLWYLPLPLALVLAQWWGPRVLLGLYLNAVLSAGYWGLYHWWFWPLYGMPVTLKATLSWFISARLLKGKPWMPDLANLTRFIFLGAVLPCLIGSLFAQALFGVLGDVPWQGFLRRLYAQVVLDSLSLFALTVPVLIFCTSGMERLGLSRTRGAWPRAPLFPAKMLASRRYEVAALFLALLGLNVGLSIERFWFLYGFFLLWAAVRFGVGLASIACVWAILLALPLPAALSSRFAAEWFDQESLIQMNLHLATVCFAALVVGRALSDLTAQVEVRSRAEADLGKSRALLEHTQEIAGIGYVYVEPATGKRIWSRNLKLIYGLDPDGPDPDPSEHARILGMGPETWAAMVRDIEQHGSFIDEGFGIVRADGEKRTLRVLAKREEAAGDRPASIAAVFQDVTEWEVLQKKAREEEDRYRTLFDSAADAILLAEEGRVLACNPAALRIFGCDRDYLIGHPARDFSPPSQPDGKDSKAAIAAFRDAAMGGAPQRLEWFYRRADGTLFEAETTLNAVAYGSMRRLLVVIRDLSARRRMERALIESEERFRQMAENIAEVFFLLDCAAGTFLYVSPIAKDMLGLPLPRLAAEPGLFFDRIADEDRERLGIVRATDLCLRPMNEELRYARPDGQTRWLRLRSFLVPGRDGSAYRVAGVIADISEYKSAQEEARQHQQRLIQSDKMNSLGLMVSGVAHEINNPNNLIMLNSDVMDTFWKHMRPVLREHAEAHPDWKLAGIPYGTAEGKYETLLAGVMGGSKRIKRIVESLKDFARIDRGDVSEAVDLDHVVDASVGIVGNIIRKSTDHFSIERAGGLPKVQGNFQKLEQVIINLITNACQSLESRSKSIRISTWQDPEEGWVGVRVEDEGKGIPAENLGKVTDPFFTTKRDMGGTGLGLSVSYGIIREHRGRMEISSEVARGTRVEIRIPALDGGKDRKAETGAAVPERLKSDG